MKRKFENIAIILFLAVLVTSILGIIFIQQNMSAVVRSVNLDQASELVSNHGNTMLYIISIQIFLSFLFLIHVFQSIRKIKNERLTPRNPFENNLNVNDKSAETNAKVGSIKQIEQIRFEKLSKQIEEMGQQDFSSTTEYCDQILSEIAKEYQIFQGIFYTLEKNAEEKDILKIGGSYAFNKNTDHTLKLGEGLAGQVAKAKRTVNIKQIPSGYIKAISGLGESTPSNLLICPIVVKDETIAVLELATFKEFSKEEESNFATLGDIIKDKLLALR